MSDTSAGGPERGGPVFDTEVVAVGESAGAFFDAGIVVLFGEDAPEELAEVAVIHRPRRAEAGPRPGDEVEVADQRLQVLAVGDVAEQNLLNLGHLVLKRNGETSAALPGDVCCDTGPLPDITPGSAIRIHRP